MNYISDLPLELLKYIAAELPALQDVLSFSLVSSIFHDAVNSDQVVYQALFLKIYEPPAEPVGYDWKTKFRLRQARVLSDEIVTEMIYEARPSRKSYASVATSANIEALSLKFPRPEDIPMSLDTLLYPLKTIQYVSDETWIPWPSGKFWERVPIPFHMLYDNSTLSNYREKTAEIGDLIFTILWHQMMLEGSLETFDGLRVKLEPYMLPNYWEGMVTPDAPIPTRWLALYIQRGSPRHLSEIKLVFSDKRSFSAEGGDIEPYTIRNGTVGKADSNGRRTVKWRKSYASFGWDYEGILDYGSQRMMGVWGPIRASGGAWPRYPGPFGFFMYWAIPEDAPNFLS